MELARLTLSFTFFSKFILQIMMLIGSCSIIIKIAGMVNAMSGSGQGGEKVMGLVLM